MVTGFGVGVLEAVGDAAGDGMVGVVGRTGAQAVNGKATIKTSAIRRISFNHDLQRLCLFDESKGYPLFFNSAEPASLRSF